MLYAGGMPLGSPPRMLPPSAAKLVYANEMNDFWYGAGEAGCYNFGMAIIGFSLPVQDDYARQIFYSLITKYQRRYWDKEIFGLRKTPLVIVDFFSEPVAEQNFRERYRFVDWSRADLIGSGFNLDALDKIFA